MQKTPSLFMISVSIFAVLVFTVLFANNVNAATCIADSQCGTNSPVGNSFCQGNSVYQDYIVYVCNSPGTAYSSCSDSTIAQFQTACSSAQMCSDGSCINTCTSDYQERCSGNNLYWYDSCGNQQNLIESCPDGCSGDACTINVCTSDYQERCSGNNLYWYDSCGNLENMAQYCQNGCSNNSCQNNNNNNCTFHAYERCTGNYLYWYDSCGNEQDMAQYCQSGCYNNSCQVNTTSATATGILTVTKTVRDLTSGSGFATSIYANPSDILMFMITLQSNGQDVQNVLVKDTLPVNLIYNNQLVVARSNNSSNNYSGDIISGINLNTISAGQTVTITYQVQVASMQNFSYGTTTLTNNVSVTSSNTGYNPVSNASVIVSRSTVLGASTVSTGLTNNFWVDSFFLPLLITLIGLWMWRSGIFFGIEKWLDDKKKIHRGYKAEKELSNRIAKIKKSGGA